MEVLYPRCAGLDVHAGSVTARAWIATDTQVTYDLCTVPTTTRALLELAEWLTAHGPRTSRWRPRVFSVYLRLRDVPLPSFWGPTVDEG
jgi:hypothetical protein